MIRWMEHYPCEERVRELGLSSLEKSRLWRDFIVAYQKGSYKEDGFLPAQKRFPFFRPKAFYGSMKLSH